VCTRLIKLNVLVAADASLCLTCRVQLQSSSHKLHSRSSLQAMRSHSSRVSGMEFLKRVYGKRPFACSPICSWWYRANPLLSGFPATTKKTSRALLLKTRKKSFAVVVAGEFDRIFPSSSLFNNIHRPWIDGWCFIIFFFLMREVSCFASKLRSF